ncbi:MAG: TIGR00645 family protein [Pseudomonadota bacterium]|nr:TIGR00645 family protein [Pseudomonadota bacterium]
MIEKIVETSLFRSRWLLAPLYIGLVGALVILMIKFIQKFIKIIPNIFELPSPELVLAILGLVDIVLIANLLLMIIFSGYENFVSKIDAIEGHVDRPEWMGKVDYSALKLKLIGSIVAISSIELLKVFIHIQSVKVPPVGDTQEVMKWLLDSGHIKWLVIIHMTFVISGVLFALMERIAHPPHHSDDKEKY